MKKRLISLALVLALMVGICPAAFAAEVGSGEETNMVDIELTINDEYGVVVSVPEDKAEEYRQRLENDPDFRQSEIDTALAFTKPTRYQRPEGRVAFEKYMYENDVKTVVDAYAGGGVYKKWKEACDMVFTTAKILDLVATAGCKSTIDLTEKIMQLGIAIVSSYEEKWWTESYRLICAGEISAVCYLIIESTVEYPKAYRVFERVV